MAQPQPYTADSEKPRPVYNIVGERVALGPGSREEQIELFYRGDNDFEVTLLSGDPLWPRQREAFEADYERQAKDPHPDWFGFLIYELATDTPVGAIGLRNLELAAGIGELGVSMGRKDFWGKGLGTEAISMVVDYGFTVLGLHNIMLSTYAYNVRAMRSYLKVGFREMGRRREAQRIGDQRYDVVYMDLLRSEFHSAFTPVVRLP